MFTFDVRAGGCGIDHGFFLFLSQLEVRGFQTEIRQFLSTCVLLQPNKKVNKLELCSLRHRFSEYVLLRLKGLTRKLAKMSNVESFKYLAVLFSAIKYRRAPEINKSDRQKFGSMHDKTHLRGQQGARSPDRKYKPRVFPKVIFSQKKIMRFAVVIKTSRLLSSRTHQEIENGSSKLIFFIIFRGF